MSCYREAPQAVSVTAEQAVTALYARHRLFPPFDQRQVIMMIEGAAEGRVWSPVGHAMRMLMDLGFGREELIRALVDLTARGALKTPRSGPLPEILVSPPGPAPALRNPHADHVVASTWDYPSGWRPASVRERIARLAKLFDVPEADRRSAASALPPQGFDTLVALSPEWLARKWGIRDPYGSGYLDLVRGIVGTSRSAYRSTNHAVAAAPLDLEPPCGLRMIRAARVALAEIERRAATPFLTYPGQLGRHWRGSSIARVEWHVSYAGERIGDVWQEFPLPVISVLFELMHAPYRLRNPGVLAIDCPGDAFGSPHHFNMHNGVSLSFGFETLHLTDRSRIRPDPVFGSATGLIRI